MKCLHCSKQIIETTFKPFCSLRCKNIDLHKWFNEEYSVAKELTAEDMEELDDSDLLEIVTSAEDKIH